MINKKIIILGASGACMDILTIIDEINQKNIDTKIEVLGFLEDKKSKAEKDIQDKVIGKFNNAKIYKDVKYITALGNEKNFDFRDKIIEKTNIPLKYFTNIVHPNSLIHKSAKLGLGNVIHAFVNIARNTKIGNHCVFLPHSTISHDSILGSHSILSTGVIISGNTKIGKLCYFGAGTVLRDTLKIGNKILTGVGTVVTKNIDDEGIYYGVPARFFRKNI